MKPEDKTRGDQQDLHHKGKQTQYGLYNTKEAIYDVKADLTSVSVFILHNTDEKKG